MVEATNNVKNNISNLGFKLFTENNYGYYMQLILPEGISDHKIAQEAAKKSIFLAPGSLFSANPENAVSSLRINVTRADDIRFYNFLKQI